MVDRLRPNYGYELYQCEKCKLWFILDDLNDYYTCEKCVSEVIKK